MKLQNDFKDFLNETVNLNQTRIDNLENRVETIKQFIRASDWEPRISRFEEQGSWAHDTIIKPVDKGEFDADLLVMVYPVEGWSAAQYVKELGREFLESRYSDMTQVYDYCVTVTYADDCKIDIAPCVVSREYQGTLEVCDKRNNKFDLTSPIDYTAWMRKQNGYSGNNSFRKATRLIKYIRDIKQRFSCQSVLLTTLIGDQINFWDKGSADFADTPTALQTIMGRMDDWLQARPTKPRVENPALPSQDFAELWNDTQYSNFRSFVNKYRKWIDEAVASGTRDDSIEKWRRVFGDEFAKSSIVKKVEASAASQVLSLLRTGAAHVDALVDAVLDHGISILPQSFRSPAHIHRPPWREAERVTNNVHVFAEHRTSKDALSRAYRVRTGEAVTKHGGLWFDVRVNGHQEVPETCYVRWRITNTGATAMAMNAGRGGFERPTTGNRRWETLSYIGVHMAEAFVIRRSDDRIVGVSDPFYVVIR